jgi:hypothetical protein
MSSEDDDARDHHENFVLHFLLTLGELSMSPEEQCAAFGNYNVAWELRYFVLGDIEVLLRAPLERLDQTQQDALVAVVEALKALPETAINPGVDARTAEGSLLAMRHPAWEAVRLAAAAALNALADIAARNKRYFGIGNSP